MNKPKYTGKINLVDQFDNNSYPPSLFVVTATKAQLEDVGIDRDICNKIVLHQSSYDSGYFRVFVPLTLSETYRTVLDFDIPKRYLKQI